ncbi:hypothetical protein SH661x_001813 [Planctomicrobium sp. SH661]|uniref:hypothetical protein n=1 Tax=Planctomicrobium sp. SH661 TaxID=3448124 RepID=UPI003F5C725B
MDTLTRNYTAFYSFAEFCDTAERSSYSPTLSPLPGKRNESRNVRRAELADAFDSEMIRRGSPVRAWRGMR